MIDGDTIRRVACTPGRRVALGVLVALVVGVHQPGHGALIPLSFEALTQKSKHVVTGKVVRMRCYREAVENLGVVLFTDVTLQVKGQYKGSFREKELTIKVPGGTVGNTRQLWPEAARFAVGELVLVFVCEVKGKLMMTGWKQGKYRLSANGATVLGKGDLPIGRSIPLSTAGSQVRLFSVSAPASSREKKGRTRSGGDR